MKPKIIYSLGFLLLNIAVFSCGNKAITPDEDIVTLRAENARLKKEDARLKTENEGLKKYVEELKRTPDFAYREGIDLINNNDLEAAKNKFLEVIDKYPNSEYESKARERVREVNKEIAKIEAERRRAEREAEEKRKYEPRAEEEAIAEWINFRNNEKSLMGTVTTWRFKIDYITSKTESPMGHFGKAYDDMDVAILGPPGWTYLAASAVGKVPVVKEGDWVCVTGRFNGVSSDGVVLLTPIRVINEGYR